MRNKTALISIHLKKTFLRLPLLIKYMEPLGTLSVAQDSTETLTATDAQVIKITHLSCQEIITYVSI